MKEVVWTEYLRYRAELRGFKLGAVERIVRSSEERYFDTATQRVVAVGRHGNLLVMIPYEQEGEAVTPITIHSTTRSQINLRLRMGRFVP